MSLKTLQNVYLLHELHKLSKQKKEAIAIVYFVVIGIVCDDWFGFNKVHCGMVTIEKNYLSALGCLSMALFPCANLEEQETKRKKSYITSMMF